MHIVQHLFCSFCPDLIVSGMTEQADADDDVAFKGKAFLHLKELFLEACAAAEGYDFVFADHNIVFSPTSNYSNFSSEAVLDAHFSNRVAIALISSLSMSL